MTQIDFHTGWASIISTHILTKRMTSVVVQFHSRLRYFNSHPHEEDDCKSFNSGCAFITFQLTSSRRGWRITTVISALDNDISTHILTKRMTIIVTSMKYYLYISTHILTKRMTYITLLMFWNINISTHILTKRMTCICFLRCIIIVISTHILTKRMTRLRQLQDQLLRYFNSHPHEEDDGMMKRMIGRNKTFQLTSSRRGWHE